MFDATKLLKWRVSKYNPNAVEIVGFDKKAVPNGETFDLTIPQTIDGKKVVSIGASAFCDCSSLSSIALPDGLETIGEWAFYGCSSLSSIALPDGVKSIVKFQSLLCFCS